MLLLFVLSFGDRAYFFIELLHLSVLHVHRAVFPDSHSLPMQIHTVGPVYHCRERSEPLLRNAIKVSTVLAIRDNNAMADAGADPMLASQNEFMRCSEVYMTDRHRLNCSWLAFHSECASI